MAVAALTLAGGSVSTAQAESGQLITGLRLAYNYSNLVYDGGYYDEYDGGSGIEAGVLGRLAVIEGQMGVHLGVNAIYRVPYYWNTNNRLFETAVSVPLLFEINPFVLSGLNSNVYEMIFIQIGVQADYVIDFAFKDAFYNGTTYEEKWDRNNVNVGIVIGAVGYFNSHCSLDIRYNYSITDFAKVKDYRGRDKDDKAYLYSGSLGLSFYL